MKIAKYEGLGFSRQSLNKGFVKFDFANFGGLLYVKLSITPHLPKTPRKIHTPIHININTVYRIRTRHTTRHSNKFKVTLETYLWRPG